MKKPLFLLIALFSLFALPSCEKTQEPQSRPVVVIGPDGFSSDIVKKHPDAFPNLKKFMSEGSYSYEMRTVLPSSSGPNWKSILSGVPVEIHGYVRNSDKPDIEPRIKDQDGRFPGLFRLIREQKPEAVTGFFYNWKTMGELYDKGTENKSLQGQDGELLAAAKEFIAKENPDLTFIVFGEPDDAGHGHGWDTPEYLEACKKIDSYLGEIVETVKASPRGEETLLLFVSDHGGINKKHGGITPNEMCPIYAMAGKGIKKNTEIQDNLMVYDIASTIAHYMALTQPQAWTGRAITPEEQK